MSEDRIVVVKSKKDYLRCCRKRGLEIKDTDIFADITLKGERSVFSFSLTEYEANALYKELQKVIQDARKEE